MMAHTKNVTSRCSIHLLMPYFVVNRTKEKQITRDAAASDPGMLRSIHNFVL